MDYYSSADTGNQVVELIQADDGEAIAIQTEMKDAHSVVNLFDRTEKQAWFKPASNRVTLE